MSRFVSMSSHVICSAILCFALFACQGGKSVNDDGGGGNNNNNNTQLQPADFSEYRALIERVAPPVFELPATAPAVIEDWTDGPNPLLGKVFSSTEPMSIYANLELLDMTVANIEPLLQVDSNGTYMPDSATIANDSDAVELSALSIGTPIPTAYQEALGELRINVDYLAKSTYPGQSAGDTVEVHLGFSRTNTIQRVLSWSRHTSTTGAPEETFLFYADANLVDSSVIFRGVFYKDNGDQTTDRWVYHMETVQDTNFSYRMSWYSDDFGGQSGIGSIIGGGNKDVEFALRYRQFTPASSNNADQAFLFDQTFGPNFTAGDTTISASYNEFVNEQLIFKSQAFPQSQILSPWAGGN